MATPDKNYRANPDRAIHVNGLFTEELAATLLPKIINLRHQGNDPITVYLNSRGGSIIILEAIYGAIRSPDQNGDSCRTITVAVGEAASAAATMLSLGDYSIAYPSSVIHFHGVRRSEVDVTVEDASYLTSYLSGLNASNAVNIARKSINRLTRRYAQLLPEMEKLRKKKKEKKADGELGRFLICLQRRTTAAADSILEKTAARIAQAENLSRDIVMPAKFSSSTSELQQDIIIFKELLKYEMKNRPKGFRLDDDAVIELVNDYTLLRDYHLGKHFKVMWQLFRLHGPSLLTSRDLKTYQTSKRGANDEVDWLMSKIGDLLRMIWHFSVCLCRQLQSGENRLPASDAYWLGCVDEVLGSKIMTGERAVAEAIVHTPKKAPSP